MTKRKQGRLVLLEPFQSLVVRHCVWYRVRVTGGLRMRVATAVEQNIRH